MPDVANWVFLEVLRGAEAVLRGAGLDLLLYNLGDDSGLFDALSLCERVDAALVLCPPLTPVTPTEIEILGFLLKEPVVLVGASVPGFPSVRVDDVGGARTAVQHLINLGHRRIGLISGEAAGDGSDNRETALSTASADRRRGYREALAAAGIECDPGLEAVGGFTWRGGERAMAELFSVESPPTAVFVADDEMAMGALRALRRARLRVPEDMSVIGFGGHDKAEVFELTTVVQPLARQGKIAAELLLSLLDAVPDASQNLDASEVVVLPVSIEIRDTTCRPASGTT